MGFENINTEANELFEKRLRQIEMDKAKLSERDEAALFAQCVEYYLLKSPSTSEFPELIEMKVEGSNGLYVVKGYVDAQNSFGAKMRTDYTLHLQKVYGTWYCTDKFEDIGEQIKKNYMSWWLLFIIISAIIGLISYFIYMKEMEEISDILKKYSLFCI